ncbi:MAG: hypothetical protein ABI548_20015 [Polyangiaceae bacterium]
MMGGQRGLLAATVLGLSFFVACGSAQQGGGGSGGGGDAVGGQSGGGGAAISSAPIPLTDLCPIFEGDLCAYLTQCLGEKFRDLEQCKAEVDCYGLPELQASAAKGSVVYDPAQVGKCHARFLNDPCNFAFFLFTPDIFEVLSYCPNTITPQLAQGAACVSNGECTAGLYCKKDNGQCPGACAPFAATGESCADGTPCAPNSTCNNRDLCHVTAKAGDTCTDGSDCDDNVLCLGDNCPDKLYCDASAGSCKPGVAEGMPCGAVSGLAAPLVGCEKDLYCDAVFIDKVGACRKPGGAGTPCNQSGCTKGFHCVDYEGLGASPHLGMCSGPSSTGGNCVGPADCATGLVCSSGLCGAPLALGTSCTQDEECAPGDTCDTTCKTAAYPSDDCGAATTACVFSRCLNGKCVDHQKVGAACAADAECTTQRCVSGVCVDTSVCQQ